MKCRPLDAAALADWPLPAIAEDADKEERGRVVVIGGSPQIAGAVQLAGVAALRAGAGKLVIATADSVAPQLGQWVPEARVIGLRVNEGGSFHAESALLLRETLAGAAAVLIGPGMMDARGNLPFVGAVLDACRHVPVLLDACAMDVVKDRGRFDQPVMMTPHAGEMAHLAGIAKDEVTREAQTVAMHAAQRWNATVALKGAITLIASPGGDCWRHDGGHPGLATSGSGDVLAGLIAGCAARGAGIEQACAWGVVMHGLAGCELAGSVGEFGYLARELPAAVPKLMEAISRRVTRARSPKAA